MRQNHLKHISLFAGAVILATGLFYAARQVTFVRMAHAQITVVPFTVQMDISYPDTGGNMVVFKKKVVARRSDGATALQETVGPVNLGRTARKVIFLDGRSQSFVDDMKIRSTWPVKAAKTIAPMKADILNPAQDCVTGKRLGYLLRFDTLNGERVAVVQSEEGGYRLTRWLAPRLGCEALAYESEQSQNDGSFKLAAQGKLVNLVFGDPDARLFDEGADYTELKPSDVQNRFAESAGLTQTEEMRQQALKLDKTYGIK